jgi:ADP-heptose:LPS heptosyltransferase
MAVEAEVRRIAVVRANGLGDYLFALPALQALRSAYPDAEIVYLGQAWHRTFLEGRPGPVNRVMVIPACRGVGAPEDAAEDQRALETFFESARREQFDIALQLHGGGRYSNPFVRRLGARLTAGLKSDEAVELDRWVPYIYFQPEVPRYLEVVALVGALPESLEPKLELTGRDRAEAAAALPESGQPLVALHPKVGDPRRQWPLEKFARLGDLLAKEGAQVVITGSEAEQDAVHEVQRQMRQPAQPVRRLSLGGLGALFERTALLVANDSGPLHLAAAVGTSTVGVFWCGNMITAAPLGRRRHYPLISWRLECSLCGRNTIHDDCGHRVSFVFEVSLEAVADAARAALFSHLPTQPASKSLTTGAAVSRSVS